ncbi:FMN-binding protein [Kosmotoga arenicorallina S304]|uniref:FMN-binding protein n=1 Tax=Kosmotoga arenicorallina S304 TaxID=1453497 RepID=A0A176JZJ5_9BACT|nr:FMN-binding protein [Kosmotoga arenicorallina]OAA29429.1 FMN-binding protein [Kosmotoga arenicorallina S304]
MKKTVKRVLIVVVAAVVLFGCFVTIKLSAEYAQMKKELKTIVLSDIDYSNLEDGNYFGNYKLGLVSAKVRVKIDDGKISDIEIIEHITGKGKKAEGIIDAVIEEQSVKVDIISGATYSSKTILKAIENAVRNGEQNM